MSFGIIGILFLLIPLGSGALLIIFARRRGKGYPACGKCGYDVSGSVGTVTRCPECGSAFTEVGILPPRGKRNPIMLALGIVIIVSVLGCVGTGLITARSARIQQRAAVAAQAAAQQQAVQQSAAADATEGSASESSPEQTQDD